MPVRPVGAEHWWCVNVPQWLDGKALSSSAFNTGLKPEQVEEVILGKSSPHPPSHVDDARCAVWRFYPRLVSGLASTSSPS